MKSKNKLRRDRAEKPTKIHLTSNMVELGRCWSDFLCRFIQNAVPDWKSKDDWTSEFSKVTCKACHLTLDRYLRRQPLPGLDWTAKNRYGDPISPSRTLLQLAALELTIETGPYLSEAQLFERARSYLERDPKTYAVQGVPDVELEPHHLDTCHFLCRLPDGQIRTVYGGPRA